LRLSCRISLLARNAIDFGVVGADGHGREPIAEQEPERQRGVAGMAEAGAAGREVPCTTILPDERE
jgi:hypothetical protein